VGLGAHPVLASVWCFVFGYEVLLECASFVYYNLDFVILVVCICIVGVGRVFCLLNTVGAGNFFSTKYALYIVVIF